MLADDPRSDTSYDETAPQIPMHEPAIDGFDRLRTPIALLCPIDEEPEWFKAKVGLKPITKADLESRLNAADSSPRLRQCDASDFHMARADGPMGIRPLRGERLVRLSQ